MIAKARVKNTAEKRRKMARRGVLPRGFLDPTRPGMRRLGGVSSRAVLLERALPLAILVVAVVAVPVMILSPTGLGRLGALRQERTKADEEISRLGQQITELRAEVKRIKDDPAAVERVARDELGLVRQTEVVFQFKE